MADSVVPVIDIAPFLTGGREDKARVAAEVDDACREIGFLVIAGHGVAQGQIDEMGGVTRAFFDLPHWEKLRVKMPPDRYRGLMTVGSEDTAYSMDEEENAPDWRESFVIGPHDHAYDEYHYGPRAGASSPRICGPTGRRRCGRCGRPIIERWSAWQAT